MSVKNKKPEIADYWFDRYIKADSTRNRILFLYHALGSLPGGFPGIIGLFEACGEKELGHELLREIAKLRAEDDETGPVIYKCGFDDIDIKRIENIFVKCLS